ncbi:hypothetical protein [Streptomyces sp. CB01881]|uniref:hypothetical protein n=1 Tax=Streptomyces sp. CB01881 TaxID=2078691 RepID=UPI000CDC16BF|nr:hypothetical protein [Streptomyces sp. CB01881]AUY52680.1 hypothetical protein C2142_31455 [Streptomyces sp. CB01881]TYC70398.1 hypothetical protein EH183_31520 [Streptomyces sp. CB01881]
MDGYDVYRAAMSGDHWWDWWVNWPLSNRIRLGDVYEVQGNALRRAGDLAGRGITFTTEDGTPPATYAYDSQGSVAVTFKASGKSPAALSALTKADAGAAVEFRRDRTAFVAFQGISQTDVADVRALAKTLTEGWVNKSWDESLRAVTSVLSVAAGTVLTAAAAGASAELRLSGAVGAGGPTEVLDLAVGASVVRRNALGAEWTGPELTPFYQVVRLRETWLGKLKADFGPPQPGRGAFASALPPIVVEEIRDDPDAVLTVADPEEQLPFATGEPG